ncbi:hypothetical protein EV383_2051 [Pseudonocardia sediminis]|uniref:Uncharacterized protein n=1 Tax=Pseudonocardia sediminis TaxID=1397368 RepID=A0A4Q7UTF3_PSEST|nr:hypothetical protein [Pseudonocardia sediminis]RZT85187.1 hypothetical protein EV383_2051 [Pseudonocardia sediminis]
MTTPALLSLVALGLFVAAVARAGLWLVGEHGTRDADVAALRAGAVTFLAGLGLVVLVVLFGPATPAVLATIIGAATLYLAATRGPGLLRR